MSSRVLVLREAGKADLIVADSDTEYRVLNLDDAHGNFVAWVRRNSDVVCLRDHFLVDPDLLSDEELAPYQFNGGIVLRPYEDWTWGENEDWREIDAWES